jgi:hypothetical protein
LQRELPEKFFLHREKIYAPQKDDTVATRCATQTECGHRDCNGRMQTSRKENGTRNADAINWKNMTRISSEYISSDVVGIRRVEPKVKKFETV